MKFLKYLLIIWICISFLYQLYLVLLAVLALMLGALPVGAGWYPWYVGWILMLGALVFIFILFSADSSPQSVSLFRRWSAIAG